METASGTQSRFFRPYFLFSNKQEKKIKKSDMSSIGTAVRIKTRLSIDNARDSFEGSPDPYSQLTSKIPSVQDRILDEVLEKLMLDGSAFDSP
jgi:hypothetical protein